MRILIDADGCPVVDIAVCISNKNNTECIIICDTSHVFEKEGVKTITVSKGADSVDFALVNMIAKGDIIITQDYGLAAMCLARGAIVINQDGMRYDSTNIDGLLMQRHMAKKILKNGGRLKGIAKRCAEQDKRFEQQLQELLK